MPPDGFALTALATGLPFPSMGSPSPWYIACLPNALSIARVIIALVFPLLGEVIRLPALIFAAVSDALDGYIARRFKVTSWTGALMDAAADKLLAVMVLGTFTYEGLIDLWQLPLLLARDVAVGGIYLYIAMKREWVAFRRVKARLPGKLTTIFVFTFVIAVLVWPAAAAVLFWPTVLISIVAALDYLIQGTSTLRVETSV